MAAKTTKEGNVIARQKLLGVGLCFVSYTWAAGYPGPPPGAGYDAQPWRQSFAVEEKDLATVGENPYFILKPGYQLTLEEKDSKDVEKLIITVLSETKNVGGVETRIVEERETDGDELVEVSRNYFAIAPQTGDVYYFGEDVDNYKKGKIVNHNGSWQHGSNGARFGLIMPGTPTMGERYYQEQAPKVAMDRAEIVSVTERVTTPAGSFERCLKTKETSSIGLFGREFKLYAPGVGLIKEGSLELVSHKYVGQ